MSTLTEQLAAGGILAPQAEAPADPPVDPVHARAYTHPALRGRTVVRLSAAPLASADDVQMSILGFGDATDLGPVGQQRRRVLGFPGWALVNDPPHARFALDVYARLQGALRLAASRPGTAKERVDGLAVELGRSVPHFLPTFHEEAGRGFLEAGSAPYAAQYFEKARQAERVYGLAVDEDLRQQAFLEFALAGALSIKSLSAYAKDLRGAYAPEQAFAHFRALCVRRILGGLPPWAGMAKELRGLADAAGGDADASEQALLAELIDSPALRKAPAAFWKGYRKAAIALAHRDPTIVAALLDLLPAPPNGGAFGAWWLALLGDIGALDALEAGSVTPRGGISKWLERLVDHLQDGWRVPPLPEAAIDLLPRLAPRLKAAGAPIRLTGRWDSLWHLDLVDLALSLGIPVADPEEDDGVDLDRWAEHAGAPGLGRDLDFAAGDPRFAELMVRGLDSVAGEDTFESAARGRPALATARHAWLERLVAGLGDAGLPGLAHTLDRVADTTSAALFDEFPDLYPAFEACSAAASLARTLRVGFIGELGWPALDEALAEAGQDRWIGGTWPYLVVASRTRLIVVGPAGRVSAQDWSCGPKEEPADLIYVDGQVRVLHRRGYRDRKGFWTGSPGEVFEAGHAWGAPSPCGYAAHLPGGGVSLGDKPLHVGDTADLHDKTLFSDGSTLWAGSEDDEGDDRLRELDPATGALGRVSLPRFLEDFAAPDRVLDLARCSLMPLPAGAPDSPLGSRDGLIGFRSRTPTREATPVESESIDGRRFVGVVRDDAQDCDGDESTDVVGLLRLPGDDAPRPVVGERSGRWSDAPRLAAPDGAFIGSTTDEAYAGADPCVPPVEYWHFMRPRDAAGSIALRAVDDATAAALIDAARALRDSEGATATDLLALFAERLPALTDPALITGVLRVAGEAVDLADRLAGLVAARRPGARLVSSVRLDGEALSNALSGLGLLDHAWGGDVLGDHLVGVARILDGEVVELPDCGLDWWDLCGASAAVAGKALLCAEDEPREVLLRFLDLWSRLPFAVASEHLRVCQYEGRFAAGVVPAHRTEGWVGVVRGPNRYVVNLDDYAEDQEARVLEFSTSGAFAPLPGAKLTEDSTLPGDDFVPLLGAFVLACRARGPLPWRRDLAERLAERTGLPYGRAALVTTGFAHIEGGWQKNFLPKALRTRLGLKVDDAALARDALRQVDAADRRAALAGLARAADPWGGWGTGDPEADPLERLAAAWLEAVGRGVEVPDDLVAGAERALDLTGDGRAMLAAVMQGAGSKLLGRDARWKIDRFGDLEADPEGCFSPEVLRDLAQLVPWLFAERPVGDAFRSAIPAAVAAARARLAHPSLLLQAFTIYPEDEDDDDEGAAARRLLHGLGGEPFELPAGDDDDDDPIRGRDAGAMVAWGGGWDVNVAVRPSQASDLAPLLRLAGDDGEVLRALAFLRSAELDALVARVVDTPVSAGAFEADPKSSAPALVAEVAAAHGLSEDAAALYLQTLALPNPTKAAVQAWNAWPPARYAKAAAALVAARLLVRAKRPRAGREHFLPCGWEALKAPHPPMESWKLPLFGIVRDGGALRMPFDRVAPLKPLHALFAEAWARVGAGDAPRYQKVGK